MMERLPCYLLRTKCLFRFPMYTNKTTTTTSLCRRSLNTFISGTSYMSSKLPVAGRTALKQQNCVLISHNLRSKLFKDVYISPGIGTKCIHLSSRRNAIPPIFWGLISGTAKLIAVLSGRKYRKQMKKQPPHIRKKYWQRTAGGFAVLLACMASIATFYYKSHKQKVPLTDRERFITLTREQSMKIAGYEAEAFVDQYSEADKLLPPDHPKVSVVVNIVNRLIKANRDFPDMDKMEWTAYVVKDEQRNAFVLPNGTMFVFTGMIDFVENEDQLACILAHEMSHALVLHSGEQLSYVQFFDYFVIVVMAAIWCIMPNDGIAIVTNWFYKHVMKILVHQPYSRVLETEADEIGLHLMGKACYDIREGSVLWHRMSIIDDLTGELRIPEWVSTHPTHSNRVKALDRLVPKVALEREQCCPPLPDLDPRRRAILLRQEANDQLVHRATKANIKRAHVDHVRSVGQQ